MDYVGNIIRPPSEADSIILQVTVGCSHNKCTFCKAYKGEVFQVKDRDTITQDLSFAQKHFPEKRRIFLADGDVLSLPANKLRSIFKLIRKRLPLVTRIACYGTARGLLGKSVAELLELKALGLNRVYLGLESGSDSILKMINKGSTVRQSIEVVTKLHKAKLFTSVMVLLGLGGTELSLQHAEQTGKVLARMSPNQIAVLTLMVLQGTPLASEIDKGKFQLPSPAQLLLELKIIIEQLENTRCQFHANHASSYLGLSGRLPQDSGRMINQIDMALQGKTPITPDSQRCL